MLTFVLNGLLCDVFEIWQHMVLWCSTYNVELRRILPFRICCKWKICLSHDIVIYPEKFFDFRRRFIWTRIKPNNYCCSHTFIGFLRVLSKYQEIPKIMLISWWDIDWIRFNWNKKIELKEQNNMHTFEIIKAFYLPFKAHKGFILVIFLFFILFTC